MRAILSMLLAAAAVIAVSHIGGGTELKRPLAGTSFAWQASKAHPVGERCNQGSIQSTATIGSTPAAIKGKLAKIVDMDAVLGVGSRNGNDIGFVTFGWIYKVATQDNSMTAYVVQPANGWRVSVSQGLPAFAADYSRRASAAVELGMKPPVLRPKSDIGLVACF